MEDVEVLWQRLDCLSDVALTPGVIPAEEETRPQPRTRTTIDDLVTLCPSCHAMIHRMRGHEHDVKRLKRLIATIDRH